MGRFTKRESFGADKADGIPAVLRSQVGPVCREAVLAVTDDSGVFLRNGVRQRWTEPVGRLIRVLPKGRLLPEEAWARRHRWLVALLFGHAPILAGFGLAHGSRAVHALLAAAAVVVPGLVASCDRFRRSVRASAVTFGLVSAAAVAVDLSHGLIEMHFYFFVIIGVIALYQDWLPFLLAIGFVAVHHGVVGILEPHSVFNHPQAWANPWGFAALHAGFVLAASLTCLISWRASEQAFQDPLTGLVNRSLLTDRVGHALDRADRHGEATTVLFIDLDNFKTVNDSLGHAAGDELLVILAQRLEQCLRKADTGARFGGDEFAVLLEDTGECDAGVVADKLLASLREPVTLHHQEIFPNASIGIATTRSAQVRAEELLRDADVALYVAKRNGKGRHEQFQNTMHADAMTRLELRGDLEAAVRQRQFVLHYQPIVDLESGRMTGMEALVRWQHPTKGLLAPGDFITLAEETGLIWEIGAWVLDEACRQTRKWHQRDLTGPLLTIAVNVSARQLQRPNFPDVVAEALRTSGLDPTTLVLELTESVLATGSKDVLVALNSLKALGVQLAIDDFGTGYSSLSYLDQFPIDILKIDRSFANTLSAASAESSLIAGVINLGQTLNLKTVAEGIENSDQLHALRQLGCAYGQGFLLARPADISVVDALVDNAGRENQSHFPQRQTA